MIVITADVLNSVCFDSSTHKFSLAILASEVQKTTSQMKMKFLLVCGYLATISLKPWIYPKFSTFHILYEMY